VANTADQALFEILRERNLVPARQLQQASSEAEREGLPLEQVLLRDGLLRPAVCEHLLQSRAARSRTCTDCGEVGFVLDETRPPPPCEHCGGELSASAAGPAPFDGATEALKKAIDHAEVAVGRSDPPPTGVQRVLRRPPPRGSTGARRGEPRPAAGPAAGSGRSRRPPPPKRGGPPGGVDAGPARKTGPASTPGAAGRPARKTGPAGRPSGAGRAESGPAGRPSGAGRAESGPARKTGPAGRPGGAGRAESGPARKTGPAGRPSGAGRAESGPARKTGPAGRPSGAGRAESGPAARPGGAEGPETAKLQVKLKGLVDRVVGQVSTRAERLAAERLLSDPSLAQLAERVADKVERAAFADLERGALARLPHDVARKARERLEREAERLAERSVLEDGALRPLAERVGDEVGDRALAELEARYLAHLPAEVAVKAQRALEERLLDDARLEPLVERVEERVRDGAARGLEQDYLRGLPERITDEVTARVLEAVKRRLGHDELPRLTSRVAAVVEERLGEGDLADRVAAEVERRVRRRAEPTAGLAEALADPDLLDRLAELLRPRLGAPAAAGGPRAAETEAGTAAIAEAGDAAVREAIAALRARLQEEELPEGLLERLDERTAERTRRAVEERLADLDLPGLPERVADEAAALVAARPGAPAGPAAPPSGALAGLAERLLALEEAVEGDELKTRITGHALDSIWAHLEQTGLAGFPDRIAREVAEAAPPRSAEDAADAANGELAGRVAAVEERLESLDPAELPTRVTGHVLESIWAHLEQTGLAGFPDRIAKEVADAAGERPGGEPAPAAAAAEGFEARLSALEARLSALEAGGAAGGYSEEFVDQVQQLAEETAREAARRAAPADAAALEARVAALEAGGGAAAGPAGASPDELADQVVQLALEAVEERAREQDADALARRATELVVPAVEERLQGWEPSGWREEVVELVSECVSKYLTPLELDELPERARSEAIRKIELLMEDLRGDLRGEAYATLRKAAEDIDLKVLAERVAVSASAPIMQAIDRRLNELDFERLPDDVVRRLVERVGERVLERLNEADAER